MLPHTLRRLCREPLVTGTMVATLALAIGATTAIFAVVDAVLLRPLPYSYPDPLVVAWQQDRADRSWFTVSPANYLDWQSRREVFDALGAIQQFQDVDFSLAADGQPSAVKGVHVSPELFQVLGTSPALGRVFTAAD